MEISKHFDTHKYVKKLKEAGVPEKQAEAEIEIWAELIESNLATKSDIRVLQSDIYRLDNDLAKTKAELQKEIQQTKAELQKEIQQTQALLQKEIQQTQALFQKEIEVSASKTKVEIIKWVAALLLAQAGLIFTLVKLFG